ncbi:cytochrome P450 [Serendipita vermifera]|nr:cytochrome P450 [Serendipita vermifera]
MAKYSRFLLRSFFNTFLRPPLFVYLFSKFGPPVFPKSFSLSFLVYFASIPVAEVLSSLLSSRRKRKDCERLGAVRIPKIKGKKIGNYDILQELIEAEDEDYPGDIFLRWASEYGPTFDMNILWASQIVTVDPENIKFVLSNAFTSFEKSEKFHDMFESFWGDGIFTTDGEKWKQHRANARPFFSQEKLADFTSFDKHMNKMLDVMNRAHLEGKSLDLQDLFARYTLDTATEFLFGVSTECLEGILEDNPDALYNQFMNAFSEVAEIGAKRIRIGSTWPLFELRGDKTVAPTKVIDAFMHPTVERALRQAKAAHINSSEYTLLEHLALISNDAKSVRDEALNILFAARDTTSSLLTFSSYILMEHPDVAEKMRAEILEICQSGRLPNVADIKKMKYTEAVLNETLRLFPPVPYNIRRSIEACPLPSPLSKMGRPLYMPAKSSITYIPILIQRDPDLWGEDAAEFKPERWLSGSTPSNAFIPFNAGPRICLGQQLAYIQVSYVWARLLMSDNVLVRADKGRPKVNPSQQGHDKSRLQSGRRDLETVQPYASVVLRIKVGVLTVST